MWGGGLCRQISGRGDVGVRVGNGSLLVLPIIRSPTPSPDCVALFFPSPSSPPGAEKGK